MKQVERQSLAGASTGTARTLAVHRFGRPGARPKAYVQAALHAEEIPGLLVAHHLLQRLHAPGTEVLGELVVVPAANPIGLGQVVSDRLLGRFALGGGGNFNRHYPELTPRVAAMVGDRLGDDAAANVALVRRAMVKALAEIRPVAAVDHLRHALLSLAIDADIVLDLHCDEAALLHLYVGTPLWPGAADLPRELGCDTVFLADISGGEPFDEACSSPWWRLPALLGRPVALPPACLAATVELRGLADVEDAVAAADAAALFRFLQRRGVIAGDPGPLPAGEPAATPLAGVEMVRAPAAGVVVYHAALGDRLAAGDLVAEVVDPMAADPVAARLPVRVATAGRLWARRLERFAQAGDIIAKIAGAAPLPGKGPLLLTSR